MSFNPEKVERTRVIDDADGYQVGEHNGEMMVLASDYDQLLQLYRETERALEMATQKELIQVLEDMPTRHEINHAVEGHLIAARAELQKALA